jgi:hypothetical protein
MQAFVQAVQELKVKGVSRATVWKEGGVLSLPEGVFFLGDHRIGSQLYVRGPYISNMEAQKAYCAAAGRDVHELAMLGTPGIGKTCLAALLISLALLDGKTVVFQRITSLTAGNAQRVYRLKLGEVVKKAYLEEAFQADLDNKETLYVVDGGLPAETCYRATCHIFASPVKEVRRQLVPAWSVKIFYLPLWSLPEALECKKAIPLYQGLSHELVEQLFQIGGGVARTIFHDAVHGGLTAKELACQLSSRVSALTLADIQAITVVLGQNHFPVGYDKLFHWEVPNETAHLPAPKQDSPQEDKHRRLTHPSVQYASSYVAALAGVHHHSILAAMAKSFIITHTGHYEASSSAGHQFERIAHAILHLGGQFDVRLLGKDTRYLLELPASTAYGFNNVDEAVKAVKAEKSLYLLPFSKTNAAIDALCSPAVFFQVSLEALDFDLLWW